MNLSDPTQSLSSSLDEEPRATVALVETYWMGHHPSWYQNFVKVLVEQGYRVVGFCPAPEEMKHWASTNLSGHRRERCEFFYRGVYQCSPWIPSRLRPRISSVIQYLGLARALKKWERSRCQKIDLVFFACIYDFFFEHFNKIARFFSFSVSGLYLHCRSIRMPGSPIPQTGALPCLEKFWGRKPFESLAILDEGAMEEVEKIGGGRPVVWIPDLTASDLPKRAEGGIASKLSRYSKGQPIILLAGHIQPTKGAMMFCDLADRLRNEALCFGMIGEVAWEMFPREDQKKLKSFAEQHYNLFTHLTVVADQEINDCISRSQVIFAAYRSFPNSSNILSKAVQFRKPIIVSDGYLMAERVRKFRLGIVIPEGDRDAACEAVLKLAKDPGGWCREMNPDWDGYRAEHSIERLSKGFEKLVQHSLKQK